MKYIDAHCHPNLDEFAEDRHEIIQRMADMEVGGIVVGVNQETSKLAVELAEQYDHLWAVVGHHPAYVHDEEFDADFYRALLKHPKVVGVGECGFDFYRAPKADVFDQQEDMFRQQIELAREFDKPLMLHIRPTLDTYDAYDEALRVLAEYSSDTLCGEVHFYSGNAEQIKQFVDFGFYISLTGVVTFVDEFRELVKIVPDDRLIAETDAPYAAPTPYRNTRCLPQYVINIVEEMADIREQDPEEARIQILENTKRLWGI